MSLLGQMSVVIGVTTVGTQRAVREIQLMEATVKKAQVSMMSLGRVITQFASLPATIITGASLANFSKFEFSIAKITGLVGIASEQSKAWGKDLLNMSSAVGKGANELADALYYVTSSGFKGGESMKILEVSAKAAASGLGETKNVADIVTSAMNAYGASALSAAEATNVLVMAVREGKGEPEELTRAFATVIPIGAKLSIEFHELGGAIAALTRLGMPAATAAVYLRQTLFTLTKPSKQTRDALKGMGTSAEELRNSLENEGLLTTLRKLGDLTSKFGEEAMARVFPNIRAFMGVISLLQMDVDEVNSVFENTKNSTNALNDAFAAASETLKFKMNVAVAQGQATLIKLGEVFSRILLPVIERVGNWLESFGDSFSKLSKPVQDFIAAINLIVIVSGPILLFLSFIKTIQKELGVLYEKTVKYTKAIFQQDAAIRSQTNSIMNNSAAWKKNAADVQIVGAAYEKAYILQSRLAFLQSRRKSIASRWNKTANEKGIVAAYEKAYSSYGNVVNTTTAKLSLFRAAQIKFNQALIALSPVLAVAGKALKGFVTILKNNWLAILLIGVPLLINWINKTKELTGAQKYLQDATDKITESIESEKSVLTSYLSVASNENMSKQTRLQAIKEINKISPEYLGYIDEEAVRMGSAKTAIDAYISALEARNKQEILLGEIMEYQKQREIALAQGAKAQITLWEQFKAYISTDWMTEGAKGYKELLNTFAQSKLDKKINEYDKAITKFYASIAATPEISQDILKGFDYVSEQAQSLIEQEKSVKSALSNATGKTRGDALNKEAEYQSNLRKTIQLTQEKLEKAKEEIALVQGWSDEYTRFNLAIIKNIKLTKEEERRYAQLQAIMTAGGNKRVQNIPNIQKIIPTLEKIITDLQPKLKKGFDDANSSLGITKEELTDLQRITNDYADSLLKIEQKAKLFKDYAGSVSLLEDKFESVNSLLEGFAGLDKNIFNELVGTKNIQQLIFYRDTLKSVLDTIEKANEYSIELSKINEDWMNVQTDAFAKEIMITSTYTTALNLLSGVKETAIANANLMGEAISNESAELQGMIAFLNILKSIYKSLTPEQQKLVDTINEQAKVLKRNVRNGDEYKTIFEDINKKIEYLGKTVDSLEPKLSLLGEQLRMKMDVDTSKFSPKEMEEWVKSVKNLKSGITYLQGTIEILNTLETAISDIFIGLAEGIGQALVGVKDGFKNLLQIIIGAAQKIGQIMMAIGTGLILLGGTSLFGWAFKKKGTSLIIGGAAIVALTAGISAAMNKKEEKAIGMAQGGIVPQGYQNDSYPAMLTSGEAVIPPGKLPNFEKQTVNVNVVVEGVVKGQDIHYIVKEVERKYKNAY